MHHGMYIPLAKSFLNLSSGRCYKIYNLLWDDAKEEFWNLLHDGYAEKFGWYNHEKTDFESKEVCEFVANVGLYSHDKYIGRNAKGKNIKLDRLDKKKINRRIKEKRQTEKTKNAFSKIGSILLVPIKVIIYPFKLIARLFKKKEN